MGPVVAKEVEKLAFDYAQKRRSGNDTEADAIQALLIMAGWDIVSRVEGGYILTENPNYNSVSVEEAIRIVKQKKLNEDTGLKILTTGNPPHIDYTGLWTCARCGCKWTLSEKYPEPPWKTSLKGTVMFYMDCPTCGSESYHATNKDAKQYANNQTR